jgi:hypothetical protein
MRFLVRWLALFVGLINIVLITIIYHTLGRLSRDNMAHFFPRPRKFCANHFLRFLIDKSISQSSVSNKSICRSLLANYDAQINYPI